MNCERRTLKLTKTAGKLVRINIFILLALASNVFNTKRIFPRQMQLYEGGKQKRLSESVAKLFAIQSKPIYSRKFVISWSA